MFLEIAEFVPGLRQLKPTDHRAFGYFVRVGLFVGSAHSSLQGYLYYSYWV